VGVIASTAQFIPYLIPLTVEDRAQLQRVETDEDEGGSMMMIVDQHDHDDATMPFCKIELQAMWVHFI
jgi:hypothetical protein